MAEKATRDGEPITIKKYANRRLYNTATSSYVTLDHLCQMVQEGVDFVVYDAKSGEDITRPVLTQIIVEEEAKGQNLLPLSFLRQLISFYGDSLQWMVPRYLESSMDTFSQNQEQMREYMQNTLGGLFPFQQQIEDMGKQNLAMFEQAMKMFAPFAANQANGVAGKAAAERKAESGGGGKPVPGKTAQGKPANGESDHDDLDQLKRQLNELQKQIEALSKTK